MQLVGGNPQAAAEVVALDLAFDQQQLVFLDLRPFGFPQLVEHGDFELRGAVIERTRPRDWIDR